MAVSTADRVEQLLVLSHDVSYVLVSNRESVDLCPDAGLDAAPQLQRLGGPGELDRELVEPDIQLVYPGQISTLGARPHSFDGLLES